MGVYYNQIFWKHFNRIILFQSLKRVKGPQKSFQCIFQVIIAMVRKRNPSNSFHYELLSTVRWWWRKYEKSNTVSELLTLKPWNSYWWTEGLASPSLFNIFWFSFSVTESHDHIMPLLGSFLVWNRLASVLWPRGGASLKTNRATMGRQACGSPSCAFCSFLFDL